MKKFLSLLLAAAMLCTLLVGCGSKSEDVYKRQAAGVVQPVPLEVHLVGKQFAVQRAEGAEGVGGKEAVSYTHLRIAI